MNGSPNMARRSFFAALVVATTVSLTLYLRFTNRTGDVTLTKPPTAAAALQAQPDGAADGCSGLADLAWPSP